MSAHPAIRFNDGRSIPQLGLGVWKTSNEDAAPAVRAALEAGYRHVDTAVLYGNEEGVGEGVRASGVPRGEVFLTTKVWNEDQGFDRTLRSFDESLKRLGTDRVDLYLIHWPSPRRNLYVETWKALVRLREEGRAKSIGVSNFGPAELERIVGETGTVPALNQVELHPRFPQRALREVHARMGIATESWAPLGRGELLDDPRVLLVARKHGKTPAQALIRWHLDQGLVVIPKSANPARIASNAQVFDFALDAADMDLLAELAAKDGRMGPDPSTAEF